MNRRETLKLLGYTVSATAMTELFVACEKQAQLSWKPVFLSNNQAQTIAEIAETILPKTTTPGAKDLGVPQFIDQMLKELLSETEQKDFTKGLEDFEAACKTRYQKSFVECTTAQREEFCLEADHAASKTPASIWGIILEDNPKPLTFYRRMKHLTLFGYFTSQKVGKEILSYDPVPGRYIGCMPLSQVGNAWNE